METKVQIFLRLPPGDRWTYVAGADSFPNQWAGTGSRNFNSLTAALEDNYQRNGDRQYYIDAAAGKIYKVITEAEPEPQIPRFSIYGDQ